MQFFETMNKTWDKSDWPVRYRKHFLKLVMSCKVNIILLLLVTKVKKVTEMCDITQQCAKWKVVRMSMNLVNPAWLRYSLPEIRSRKETEIGLKELKPPHLGWKIIWFDIFNIEELKQSKIYTVIQCTANLYTQKPPYIHFEEGDKIVHFFDTLIF